MYTKEITIAPARSIQMNRAQRRRAAKKRRRAALTKAAVIAAFALTAGILFGGSKTPEKEVPQFTPAPSAQQEIASTYLDNLAYSTTPETEPEIKKPLLASCPLDMETQERIYTMCGESPELFCTVMAIAQQESRFDPEAVGDDGKSIGMMQIHTYWQRDRIERLGITDLTDIEQNMTVALDFLGWIAERLAPEHPDSMYGYEAMFMVYNCGLQGAVDLWEQGITDTQYSRSCMAIYEAFMAEMEVRV